MSARTRSGRALCAYPSAQRVTILAGAMQIFRTFLGYLPQV